jgi:hypothetical protein
MFTGVGTLVGATTQVPAPLPEDGGGQPVSPVSACATPTGLDSGDPR